MTLSGAFRNQFRLLWNNQIRFANLSNQPCTGVPNPVPIWRITNVRSVAYSDQEPRLLIRCASLGGPLRQYKHGQNFSPENKSTKRNYTFPFYNYWHNKQQYISVLKLFHLPAMPPPATYTSQQRTIMPYGPWPWPYMCLPSTFPPYVFYPHHPHS